MIVRKNLPKFLIIPALVLALLVHATAEAAPKTLKVQSIAKWSDAAGAELITATNKSVITVKNVASASADIEIQARDFSGTLQWSKTIDSGFDEVATKIATDSQGNIWLAGNSAVPPVPESSTSATGGLNPDGVIVEPAAALRPDMRLLTLWKLNSLGEVQDKFTVNQNEISLVDAVAVSATGVSILASRDSGHFVISANLKGLFGSEVKIGTNKTKLNALVRSPDGSINVFGSSAETLGGKKLVGREDGVLIKINKLGKVVSVVRSTSPKSYRTWNSATATLLLTGSVRTGALTESAITKFANNFTPTWTTRISSSGPALAANGPNKSGYVILEPTGTVKGVSNFQSAKGQNLITQFDGKGVLIGAFTSPELTQVKAAVYSLEGGLFLLTESSIFRVGASK